MLSKGLLCLTSGQLRIILKRFIGCHKIRILCFPFLSHATAEDKRRFSRDRKGVENEITFFRNTPRNPCVIREARRTVKDTVQNFTHK